MNRIGAFLLLLCASCSSPTVAVTPRIGILDADGRIGVSSSGAAATSQLDDLGLDEDQSVPGARIDVGLPAVRIVVSGMSASLDGNGSLSGTMTQGGTTLPAGTTVDSRLDVETGAVYATFDFLPTKMLELGLGVGVTGWHIDGRVRSTNPGTPGTVSFDETFPIPVLAGFVGFTFGPIELSALLAAMKIDYSGDELTYTDADVMASWRFYDESVNGSLVLGWRHLGA